jgi:hypothetical protein
MRIIRATEAIPVEHPVFLIFGQPGICKSSLGYSTKDGLTLDFDKGAHRAANRKDTLVIDKWADVIELMDSGDVLDPYASLTVDTVGRCLDVMITHLAAADPKKFPGGNPSQQGWGVLKNTFRTWMSSLRAKGKDVLLIAHDKEDKDGDTRVVRPEIVGGSYAEVMKVSDFVGYCYMNGRERVLDFNPTDRWIGKNPAQWKPFVIPPITQAHRFMADLFNDGREALGAISEESAKVTAEVANWRTMIENLSKGEECTAFVEKVNAIPQPVVMAPVKVLLRDRAKALGFTYDIKQKAFVKAAEPATVGA